MLNLVLAVIAALSLGAAAYVHRQLPYRVPTANHLRTARLVLIGTGIVFGWVMARLYGVMTELNMVLVFAASVGIVHVPAAAILFVKSYSVDE
ncbi:hypothetical protein [Aquisalimonas sp.]|uniref:hypothetical protein n=1 Tax=unclassified Aquisalimonas TaxID=2644645 RepID=UPI0025C5F91E|nr:hypothetical protein [Aquisalimonas sp.]